MIRRLRCELLFVLVVLHLGVTATGSSASQSAVSQSIPLTNQDIVDLVNAGISPEIINAKIKTSASRFDTSPASLKSLKSAGLADAVILAMVQASDVQSPKSQTQAVSPQALAERANHNSTCPECKFILISNVDSKTAAITDDWLSKDQLAWAKQRAEEVKKGKLRARFTYTKFRENADYILLWTAAQGFRPYVTYVPRTETSTANTFGTFSTYGTAGLNSGIFNGTVEVTRTYYEAQTNQWPFVDAALTVYDKSGREIYETWHQGNFRWSKPTKDCLEDALKYLERLGTQ